MKYILYIITFPNNKKYVGITSNLKSRQYKHKFRSTCKKFEHLPLYRAIKKFGFDNLNWKIFKNFKCYDLLLAEEIKLIKKLKTTNKKFGYNCTSGGQGHLKYSPSQETKLKISLANKGKKRTKQQKENLSKSKLGSKNPMYGKTTSKKQKEAVSKSSGGENNVNAKFTKNQIIEIRKKYKSGKYSIKSLADEYSINRNAMSKIIRNKSYIYPNYIP